MNKTEEARIMEGYKTIQEEVEALAEVFDERHVMVINKTFLFGRHLLHPRMINIFTEMLKIEKDNDLAIIVISEIGPKGKYAEYFPEMKAAIISLPRLLKGSIETIESRESNLGIAAGIWTNMIYAFCHELHHNMSLSNMQDLDNLDEEREEKMADKYGMDMLAEVQRTMSAEPPALAELPWFNTRVMEHMVTSIQTGNQTWLKQQEMNETGLVWKSKDNEYTSLREYYKDTSTDQIWENEGAPLELKSDIVVKTTEEVIPEKEVQMSGEEMFKAGPEAEATGPETAAPATNDRELTAEDLEMLDMQEALAGCAPSDVDMADCIQRAEEALTTVDHDSYDEQPKVQNAHLIFNKPEVTKDGPIQTVQEACQTLWMGLYRQMFGECGWTEGKFTNVLEGISTNPITIINNPRLREIVESFVTTTRTGQNATFEPRNVNGHICGRSFVNHTLPGYEVTLNLGGRRRTFTLIAQNMAKSSPYAQRARNGDKIAWLIESNGTYSALIDNDVYHKKDNGKWTPVAL